MKPLLSPGEMLSQLSARFNKPQLSRKARADVFDFYVALSAELGASFAESNYSFIVNHLMAEVVSNPKNGSMRCDRLFIQKLVGAMLRDLIATRMRTNFYNPRALMPGQTALNPIILTIILKEIVELLRQLGNAPPPVQVIPYFALKKKIRHSLLMFA